MLELLGFPPAASAHAADIDRINVLVHWLMLVLFVGWGAFFIYTLVRFRRSAHPVADHAGIKGTVSKWIEGGVLVAEVVLLVFFSIPAWYARVDAFPAESEAVTLRVVGEQFAWNMHYPGPDRKFGKTDAKLVSADNPLGLDRRDPDAKDDITTINQMHLPVNRPVIVHLSSKDVIHSFKVFPMRVNQDAIPGMSIPVHFKPTRIGTYPINCAQLCR